MGLLLEQMDLLARLGQSHTGSQAGKSATDDEDVESHFRFWILDFGADLSS
jgi:hypothetical protein